MSRAGNCLVHYQATLNIALRWSADAVRNRVLLTLHSAGVQELGSSPSTDITLLWSEKPVLLAE